ncbi:MAG TPA: PLP-dependent lyase/thiolase, partial [Anaerolineaceae bacterium]|nr:PLP-dependent lyase/thiolase [Anaerolineaceae bacterium]
MSPQDNSYAAVMARKNEIMKASLGIDYDEFIQSPIAFDYDRMMRETGFSLEDIVRIQSETKVGNTPLYELRRLTEAVRRISPPGKGARILLKDEAANASGSFKARRASISAYQAALKGYAGMIAATSGNYGAAVASQAAQRGLKCIIVQEVYDSRGVG